MTQVISKEILMQALLDLAKSERIFLTNFISDILNSQDQPTLKITASKKTKRSNGKQKQIVPAYRQDINAIYPAHSIDHQVVVELRNLFSDEPPAETIIGMLPK